MAKLISGHRVMWISWPVIRDRMFRIPTLPEAARKTGGLDFNLDANVNVLGNIGNKLKLPISYNTQASFDWMNQLKLEYTGGADDIVKKIEVGNTSFTTRSAFMASQQSLFGIKTQFQFGKLFVTGVIASQRSQSQSTSLQGGASLTTYQFKADDYDENRHFLLAQFFGTVITGPCPTCRSSNLRYRSCAWKYG